LKKPNNIIICGLLDILYYRTKKIGKNYISFKISKEFV